MEQVLRVEQLSGRPLRYVLTVILSERGPLTVAELAAAIEQEGFALAGRPSKTISDALRWEIAHERVVRLGRGRYGPGVMPRQTHAWIVQRVDRRRAERNAGPAQIGSPSPIRQRHSDNGDGRQAIASEPRMSR